MHLAQCRKCLAAAMVSEHGTDVHLAVDAAGCTCCPQDHHHGRAAGNAAEGGVPCRPLVITLLPGAAPLRRRPLGLREVIAAARELAADPVMLAGLKAAIEGA